MLVDTIDSASAKPGDVFRFRTIDTIVAPGGVTIPRNAVGYGIVTAAVAAGAHGRSGSVLIEARYIAAHGQYQVAIDSVASAASQSGASGNVASGVGALPVPFVGSAVGTYNYLHAGKNAALHPGFRFVVVPVADLAHPPRCAL